MRYRAYREVAACLFTSLVGLAMLVLPCLSLALALSGSPVIARITAAIWALGFLHGFLSRLRYLKVAAVWLGIRFPNRVAARLPMYLLVDFLAWTIPLGQYLSRRARERW
jgi:hypothetical protein